MADKIKTFDEFLAEARAQNGRPPTRAATHPEEELQLSCLRWWEMRYAGSTIDGEPLTRLLHHSPNGGRRNAREAARFKAMGTRAGFPDLWLGIPSAAGPYLCIELKTERRGSCQSQRQRQYQKLVEGIGARYVVVRNLTEFIREIEGWMAAASITRQ